MQTSIDKARYDMRSDIIKIGISLIVAFAVAVGAGVGLATYFGKPTVNYITIQQPAK